MRSKICLLTVALAVLMLAGCVSDREPVTGSVNKKTVTFSLQNVGRGSITYVDSEAGEDQLDDLDIYMFDETLGTLEKVFRTGEISLSNSTGPNQTATVDVTECEGSKVFYFVGNGTGITSALDGVRHGETTITAFMELISDVQTALPSTPLLMTGNSRIDDIVTPAADELKISLKRRVARFDVNNDKDVTNFTITKILVNNVNMQAHIFGNALGTGNPVMKTGRPGEILFGTQTDANKGETRSVFYTWPTELGDGKTEISIEGKFRNNERLFSFQSATVIPIEANKRYMLKVEPININEIAFEVTAAEWDDNDDDMQAKPETNLITYSEIKKASGDGTFTGSLFDGTGLLDITNTTQPTVIKFTTSSLRDSGAEVKVTVLDGDPNSMKITVNDPELIVTYGGACYEQHFEVTAEFCSDYVFPAVALVEIFNAYDPIQVESFHIIRDMAYYPGTTHLPVKVGGVWWAPVNIAAKNVNGTTTSVDDIGLYFQWGRSYGSPHVTDDVQSAEGYTVTDTVMGPLSLEDANKPENINKFITTVTETDWLDVRDDTLWSGDNAQGPCPKGWRIPTWDEMAQIVDAYNSVPARAVLEGNILKVTGDDNTKTLYFPTPNYARAGSNAFFFFATEQNKYYVSDCNDHLAVTMEINTKTKAVYKGASNRRKGRTVRCVADR